jgi:rare lipoprotein A
MNVSTGGGARRLSAVERITAPTEVREERRVGPQGIQLASLGDGKPAPDKEAGGKAHKADQVGVASYYWQPQALASGGRFNPNALTAAHKTLPFGTRVRIRHLGNGRSVDVHINDRGPYVAGRIIDLSKAAAARIGMTGQGVARVSMTVLGR